MTLRHWFDLVTTRGYRQKYKKMRSRYQEAQTNLEKIRRILNERLAARRETILWQKSELARLAQVNRRLLRELGKVTLHKYGSYTAGVAAWEARWHSSPGRRVLFYAFRDYAGSFVKWASALNEHTEFAVRLVVFDRHEYDYDNDLLMPAPSLPLQGEIDRLCEEADLIHIKDEHGFFSGANGLPPDLFEKHGKPLIFTHYGGYARKFCNDPAYRAYVDRFDARVALTPDLNYDWFEGVFVPQAIDTARHAFSWTDGRVLAHSPSTAERKGTADLLAAIDGLDLEL